MKLQTNTLEEDVLGAFQRALSERRYDVADHLLRTLEIAMKAGDDFRSDSSIASAYRRLAGSDVAH